MSANKSQLQEWLGLGRKEGLRLHKKSGKYHYCGYCGHHGHTGGSIIKAWTDMHNYPKKEKDKNNENGAQGTEDEDDTPMNKHMTSLRDIQNMGHDVFNSHMYAMGVDDQ